VTSEDDKLEFEKHKNRRDEQFWFTAAVVSFNGFLLTRAEVPPRYAILSAVLISVFGIYLVLHRWSAGAGRQPPGAPDAQSASASERLRYTAHEIRVSFAAIPYVIAELSGAFFYLLLIAVSLIGVVWRNWHAF
jgi:hypothetical protein